jgi:hypothetical protein
MLHGDLEQVELHMAERFVFLLSLTNTEKVLDTTERELISLGLRSSVNASSTTRYKAMKCKCFT